MNFHFLILKTENIKKVFVAAMLFVTFFIPLMAMRNFSPAVDEITHLPSGYSYWKTGEIRLNSQHPPLIKLLASFPLLFMNIKFNSDNPHFVGLEASEWKFGQDFVFENGVDKVIFWGRTPMILISVLLGWYIFVWGKELFGYPAGIVGLFIYAFMPNIIAHSQLIATDMGVAAFSFISLYYLWKLMRSDLISKKYLIYSGIFLGLALGSKFSAVFLLPIYIIMLVICVFKNRNILGSGSSKPKIQNVGFLVTSLSFLKIIISIFGLAFLVIWMLYFFPSDPSFYWKGLESVYADSNADYQYYLNGNFSNEGWWYYFIWAFIIKTPIPFLAVFVWSISRYRKYNVDLKSSLIILLPVATFLFMAGWKAHNIGVRYILSIYPFLILFVSGQVFEVAQNLKRKMQNNNLKFKRLFSAFSFALYILSGWYIFSSLRVYPDYLAYFNELIGGPNSGYKYLDDSNVEWGHDLKRLARYQDKNSDLKVVYVWDVYVDAGRLYGIKNILSPDSLELWLNPKGKYAVSTHAVIRTKLAGQLNENNAFNSADRYKPVDRIGQSFFVYEF